MGKGWEPSSVKMVDWFEPRQLMKTALDVMFSTTLSRHADNRRAQALTPAPRQFLDYSTEDYRDKEGCFWFDYVADCGDGGNSTYMVASAVAAAECQGLPRGRLLVFGGDCVYPTASPLEYDTRLVAPYQAAMPNVPDSSTDVLAIPGNHDWYDSLSSFIRLFCSEDQFAGWKTKQTRSYFAAKLPAGWWLLGVDVALSHDIDLLQLRAFIELSEKFGPADRVILCCPEPFWIAEERDRAHAARLSKTNLRKLVDGLGQRLQVTIAGDLHHYRRYSNSEGSHRITCGTGGAFLHPTHDRIPKLLAEGYKRGPVTFPSERTSRFLTWRNVFFFFKNPSFGVLTGLLYMMIAWGLGTSVGEQFAGGVTIPEVGNLPANEYWSIAGALGHAALINEVSMGFVLAMVLGFVAFADDRYKRFKWPAGILHATFHLFAAVVVYWIAARLCLYYFHFRPKSSEQYVVSGAIMLLAGWGLGSLIMGIYLWLSLNLFGQHANEAFSALKIQDWKGFLRLRITPQGALDIHFIGIPKVPRKWRKNPVPQGPKWVPADRRGKCKIFDRVTCPARENDIALKQTSGL
jgi:hypothetical protein